MPSPVPRTRSPRRAARRRALRRAVAWSLFAAWAWLCQHRQAMASGLVAPRSPKVAGPASRLDLAAGPLPGVLDAFAAATGLPVRLDVPADVAAALSSPGCASAATPQSALDQLLAGTGLSGHLVGDPPAAVVRFEHVESVEVEGEAATTLSQSLPKLQGPLRLVPQSIDVVTGEVLQEQQATTLARALRNVPGVTLAAGEGGFQGDGLTLRGFTARNDMHLDGARDFASYHRDTFAVDEVQVLKGPSGMVFGRGSTGGVVNQTTKMPRMKQAGEAGLELGTDDTRRLTLDVSQPLGRESRGIAIRVAAVAHESGVAGRDVTRQGREGIAPSIAFGLGTPTRVTLAHFHQQADDLPDYGIPWHFHRPADVPRDSYYGYRNGSFLKTDVDASTLRVEHDFGPKLSLRNQIRVSESTRRARITSPRLAPGTTPQTPLEDVMVQRNQVDARSRETLLLEQLDFTATASTGRVTHSVVTGIELSREGSSPVRRSWEPFTRTPLLDPDPSDAFSGNEAITTDVDVDTATIAGYVVDTMRFSKRWSAVAGLRWDRFEADYENVGQSPAKFDRTDEAATWRAAVVFEPTGRGSVYASAATSFNPSAEGLSLSATTEDTDPERNRSLEIGTKFSLAQGAVGLRGAIFQTDKTAAREASTLPGDDRQILAGAQRVRGFEIEVEGRMTESWTLTAGYARLDSEVLESVRFPAAVGKPLANVPRHSFSAWSTHELPRNFELGWGIRHVGSRTASSTEPLVGGLLRKAPGFWTADLMVSREMSPSWSLQLNVTNLTDETWHEQVSNNHVIPGAARAATLGVRYAWPKASAEGGH